MSEESILVSYHMSPVSKNINNMQNEVSRQKIPRASKTESVCIRVGTSTPRMRIPRAFMDSDLSLLFNSIIKIFLEKIFAKVKKLAFGSIRRETLNMISQSSTTQKINPFGFLEFLKSNLSYITFKKNIRCQN